MSSGAPSRGILRLTDSASEAENSDTNSLNAVSLESSLLNNSRHWFLSHFRSHLAARLTLDARPIAIHGPNGAGKTNILEAVSMLSPGRGIRRAAAADMMRRPLSKSPSTAQARYSAI